jgi:hypothetical protein
MKKKNIKILIILGIVLLGASYLLYDFYNPRIGSRSGRVVDAVTGEPIEGAVVVYLWELSKIMTMGGGYAARYEGTTDKDGAYFIPAQRGKRDSILEGVYPDSVIIYKNGYAGYKMQGGRDKGGRSYGYPGKDQKHRKRRNLVKLYPLKSGESHYKHMGWIGTEISAIAGGEKRLPLLRKALEEERKLADAEGIVW